VLCSIISNSETLLKSYDWYLDNKDQIDIDASGVTHGVPWKQEILALAKKLM